MTTIHMDHINYGVKDSGSDKRSIADCLGEDFLLENKKQKTKKTKKKIPSQLVSIIAVR